MVIDDGAAVVQMLSPSSKCRTFEDYAIISFHPIHKKVISNFHEIGFSLGSIHA